MIVFGIDPGTARTGYGLVELDAGRNMKALDYGVISTSKNTAHPDRLVQIYDEMQKLLHKYQPACCAVEKLFFQKNVKTAISVGQARGVILLALAQHKLEIAEYSPNEIKQAITGYGAADKQQMQMMVRTLLNLEEIPRPDDAADALAVAMCHLQNDLFHRRIREQS